MAVKDAFKVTRKTFFNPSGWFGYELFKQNTRDVLHLIKGVATVPEASATPPLSFDEAMQQHGLTSEGVDELRKDYLLYTIIFLIFAGIALFFSVDVLIKHRTISGLVIGIAVTLLFLLQAFRYHFWYFQIKQRKLGCTFNDWKQYILGRSRPKP